MKKIKYFIAFLGVFALLFYACSKDENNVDPTNEKATLSFGAIVQDLANKAANKQSIGEMPACSEDEAAYVHIVVSKDGDDIIGETDNPFQVDLVAGQVYTKEVPELELEPGDYTLTHFSVYNSEGTLIWLAPKSDSELAPFVDNPLPMDISLGAGVKKYVDVPVLCYDDREVNQYGYLFFEFNETQAYEFCFFANYCPPDGNGRHYTANYSVNIWLGTDDTGTPLYTDEMPVTEQYENEDYYAEPTCFALPVNDDLNTPYLYYEVTLLDWPGNYGTATPNTVISGVLTPQDIMDNFDGDDSVDPEHLRFLCDDTPGGEDPCAGKGGDTDGDGICDDDDNCPFDANQYQEDTDNDGIGNVCDDTPGGDEPCTSKGGDSDEDGICDDDDNCPNTPNPDQDNRDGDAWGDVCDLCPDYWSEENEECPQVGNGCDTAYMFGDQKLNELDYNGQNWGWGLLIDGDSFDQSYYIEAEGIWEFPFYAGAGQNDVSKGWQAGTVQIGIDEGAVTVKIVLASGIAIDGSHIWFSEDGWPESRAPGQLNYNYTAENSTILHTYSVDGDGPYYLIVHGGVCSN